MGFQESFTSRKALSGLFLAPLKPLSWDPQNVHGTVFILSECARGVDGSIPSSPSTVNTHMLPTV